MHIRSLLLFAAIAALSGGAAAAQSPVAATPEPAKAPAPAAVAAYDADLAKRVGGNENGMRSYVLVILRTGPTPVPKGEKRDAMFAGHFANIGRLADAGKLVLAGPFAKNEEGWRGLYLFAVPTVEEARALTATDPVIINGEMVAEFHPWFGSAAAMLLPELHERITAAAKAR